MIKEEPKKGIKAVDRPIEATTFEPKPFELKIEDKPVEAPIEKPIVAPIEKPIVAPIEKPIEVPIVKPAEVPVVNPAE